jgi:gag-polypeptide of LTR copia-type
MAEDNTIDNQGKFPAVQQNKPMRICNTPTITRINVAEGAAAMNIGDPLDAKAKNWFGWSQTMNLLFDLLYVKEYVQGKTPCPDAALDPVGAMNWRYNDKYSKVLITSNISATERVHTNGCPTSHRMWLNLQSIHEPPLDRTNLFRTSLATTFAEGGDMYEHLTKLKHIWYQLDLFGDQNYHISDSLFKHIIASSLPPSWDQFTDLYVSCEVDTDPRKQIDSQQFIGILIHESEHRQL